MPHFYFVSFLFAEPFLLSFSFLMVFPLVYIGVIIDGMILYTCIQKST